MLAHQDQPPPVPSPQGSVMPLPAMPLILPQQLHTVAAQPAAPVAPVGHQNGDVLPGWTALQQLTLDYTNDSDLEQPSSDSNDPETDASDSFGA